ncbi:hypothetical protein CCP3SC15_490001 [Gammaproteobacteria bacterium]
MCLGHIGTEGSREEVLQLINEAIEFHLDGLKQEHQLISYPHSSGVFVKVYA